MSAYLPILLGASESELRDPSSAAAAPEFSTGARKSVVTTIVKSVSARRRAGANELPASRFAEAQRQRVQRAKRVHRPLPGQRAARRAATSSPFMAEFRLPKAEATHDIEMVDAAPASEATVKISIPERLARPKYKRVPIEKALFMNEDLREVPIEYIQDELARNGQNLLNVLDNVSVPPPMPTNTIPSEIEIEVTDAMADLPSHMLAVYKKDLAEGERNAVTMLAVHRCIWDVNCAHVPSLPSSDAAPTCCPTSPDAVRVSVPIVPLGLPAPDAFRELLCYLYTKRADALAAELLPVPPPSAAQGSDAMDRFARNLASELPRIELLKRMAHVQGVWRNACALGVFDDGLWAALDMAWDVYGKAVTTNAPGEPLPVWEESLRSLSFARCA